MKTGIRMMAGATIALLVAGNATTAHAAENSWEIEFTPYLWMAGVDADVTVGNQTANVSASFSDVLNHLDIGALFLVRAERNHWVIWTQFDYMKLSTDELGNAASGELESDVILLTAGFGREFESADARRSIDVLLGVRYMELENTLQLDTLGTFRGKRELTDPVIIVRPSLRLSERWRLNPTFSYGTGGDSESTYELQPQVQFQMNDRWALRFGYRSLQYDIKNENGNSFDGGFQGPFVGVGGIFGN